MKSQPKNDSFQSFIVSLHNKKDNRSRKQEVLLELYQIKQFFLNPKTNLSIIENSILKLAYVVMLGDKIDFGIEHIKNLITSNHYQFVRIGWLAFMIFDIRNEKNIIDIIQILQKQLASFDNEPVQSLVLSVISQIFSHSVLESVGPNVAQIAVSPRSSEFARKKALIMSGRIYQETKDPTIISILTPALPIYLGYGSYSIRMSTATLIVILMSSQPGAFSDLFTQVLDLLYHFYQPNEDTLTEDYKGTPSPWFSKQLIQILRFKLVWNQEELSKISFVTTCLFNRAGEKLPIRAALSYFIVFSEIVTLISMIPIQKDVITKCAATLSRYLESERYHMIYFALNSLNRLFRTNPDISVVVRKSLPTLFKLIKHHDTQMVSDSINLLVHLSTVDNYKEIVGELIKLIPSSQTTIRVLLCKQITLLAERADDTLFYTDTIVQILFKAGDYCDDTTWKTAVNFLENNPYLQMHTIDHALSMLNDFTHPPEQFLKFTIYISGEYICEKIDQIFSYIISSFSRQSHPVQTMMVTAMAKIISRNPPFYERGTQFLQKCANTLHPYVMHSARQYLVMLSLIPNNMANILKKMPSHMGEDMLNDMIDKIIGQNRSDSGFAMMKPNEKFLENFIFASRGYIYHDSFIRLSIDLSFADAIVKCTVQVENIIDQLALTDVTVQVVTNEDILSRSTPLSNVIPPRKITLFKIEFLYTNPTIAFPYLNFAFKCGGQNQFSVIPLPIFLHKAVRNTNINTEQFNSHWNLLTNPQLMADISIHLRCPFYRDNNFEDQSIAWKEIELILKKSIGLEFSTNLELPNCLKGSHGILKLHELLVEFYAIIEYQPKKDPYTSIIHVKSNTEKGLSMIVMQLSEENSQLAQMKNFLTSVKKY